MKPNQKQQIKTKIKKKRITSNVWAFNKNNRIKNSKRDEELQRKIFSQFSAHIFFVCYVTPTSNMK